MTASIILFADILGIAPDQPKYELKSRKQISESMAILFSTMAYDQDIETIRTLMSKIVVREQDILSAGFRLQSGRLLFAAGPHAQYWGDYSGSKSTSSHVLVPIYRGKSQIGTIELSFKPLAGADGWAIFDNDIYKLILFVIIFGFFSFLFFVLRTLRQIDPSAVIPERVNAAFDTLAEGVVILDDKEQIVLANTAFSEIVKHNAASLLGFKLSDLAWQAPDEDGGDILYPWLIAMNSGESSIGDKLTLEVEAGETRTMVINSAPIHDHQGKQQGMLLTFDDVTELELQKRQLQATVSDLESSRKEIQQQNKELHFLATRDPLTGCLNRRSFYQQFAAMFKMARTQREKLCCIMADIDHFKRVNDNFGHAVGDEVIKLLADVLQSSTREQDIIGRYGGEEFCIVLPGIDCDEAVSVAERIRLKVKQQSAERFIAGPTVSVSLGVSSMQNQAQDLAELNEQADQALYVAKEAGRDRVVNWTANDENVPHGQPKTTKDKQSHQRISISDPSQQHEDVNRLLAQVKQLEEAAEQLQHERYYDKLTGLPSQIFFYDRIKQAVERCERQGRLTAILIVTCDLFSQVNSSFGRAIADQMFISLAKRMDGIFRKDDSIALFNAVAEDLIISRFEGDEFAILLADFDDRMIVPAVVKRIADAMKTPVCIDDKQVSVSCKIGISLFPEDAGSAEELLAHANTAKCSRQKNA
nr:GGDEF domain-containing protein [Methylomarinum sp. Ch1-1]MDP4519666.1 GGDEF domain-containing protein [Methylomarinum sp. Ch1-1]